MAADIYGPPMTHADFQAALAGAIAELPPSMLATLAKVQQQRSNHMILPAAQPQPAASSATAPGSYTIIANLHSTQGLAEFNKCMGDAKLHKYAVIDTEAAASTSASCSVPELCLVQVRHNWHYSKSFIRLTQER